MKIKTGVLIIVVLMAGFLLYRYVTSQTGNPTTTAKTVQPAVVSETRPTIMEMTSTPAPSPTITSSPIPLPSPTTTSTQPPVTLQGRLFFDIDLSGKQNAIQMTYYEDLIRPKNPAFRQNQDLVKVIEEYKLKHPYANDGIRTTITEPGLSNYEVCAYLKEDKAGCVLTDTDGNFSIVESGIKMGDTVGISIKDNSDEKVGTMGYQNRYVKPVVIPAYEMNGIKVPEQNLVQTHLMKLSNTYVIAASEEKIILGLTQGYLPYPPLRGDLYIYSFFDHDERKAYGLDWRGRNGMTPNTYNHIPNKVKDNLNGVDFGGQKGDLVISLGFGVAKITESEELGKQVIVMIDNVPHYIKYSHLDTVLINDMQEVFAGQIIGINGRSGKDVGAPHVHIDVGTSGQDPFGDPNGSYAQIWTRAFSPAEFP